MQNRNRKLLIILVLALIIALGFVLYHQNKNKKSKLNNEQSNISKSTEKKAEQPNVTKRNIAFNDVSKFPKDFPFEKNANVIENYSVFKNKLPVQTTRKFETKIGLNENYRIYSDYFSINSWKVSDNKDDADYKLIIAKKDNQVVQLTISKNSITNIATVEATVFK